MANAIGNEYFNDYIAGILNITGDIDIKVCKLLT